MTEVQVAKAERQRVMYIWSSSIPGSIRFTAKTKSGASPGGLVETTIRRVFATSRTEVAIMAVTFIATLTQPLDFAILGGILFSLAFFVIRSALPRVYQVVPDLTFRHLVRKPGSPVCPQIAIMNIRGPLFFGAVHHIEEELRHNLEDLDGITRVLLEARVETLPVMGDVFDDTVCIQELPCSHVRNLAKGLAGPPLMFRDRVVERLLR